MMILEKSFLPSIVICKTIDDKFIIQQDGVLCHTAKVVKTRLEAYKNGLHWVQIYPLLRHCGIIWKITLQKTSKRSTRIKSYMGKYLRQYIARWMFKSDGNRIKAVTKNKDQTIVTLKWNTFSIINFIKDHFFFEVRNWFPSPFYHYFLFLCFSWVSN